MAVITATAIARDRSTAMRDNNSSINGGHSQ